jgi:hypothetical protein
VPFFKPDKPSWLKKKEVQYASYEAAMKEAEKILRKYSVTFGKLAE